MLLVPITVISHYILLLVNLLMFLIYNVMTMEKSFWMLIFFHYQKSILFDILSRTD